MEDEDAKNVDKNCGVTDSEPAEAEKVGSAQGSLFIQDAAGIVPVAQLDETLSSQSRAATENVGKASGVKGMVLATRWDENFARLVAFREKHGHCRVPNRYAADPQLGSWVSAQRRLYKMSESDSGREASALNQQRAKRLEQLGFEWAPKDPRHVPWEARYQELSEFVKKYGHSQVPIGWESNVKLANWVSTQRQEYKLLRRGLSSRLTNERIEQLNKINFVWEAKRGGPKRKRSASVSVPKKANPTRPTADVATGSGGTYAPSLAAQLASPCPSLHVNTTNIAISPFAATLQAQMQLGYMQGQAMYQAAMLYAFHNFQQGGGVQPPGPNPPVNSMSGVQAPQNNTTPNTPVNESTQDADCGENQKPKANDTSASDVDK